MADPGLLLSLLFNQKTTTMNLSITNLTPHDVNIVRKVTKEVKWHVATFPSEGTVRLSTEIVSEGELLGIPLTRTKFGEPEGLPNFKQGRFYIVSQLVKSALPDRTDLLVPAELVRDEKGNIIGCCSLGV